MYDKPKLSIALFGRHTIRCFGRLQCTCGRVMQAADIELRGGSTVLICQQCFCDLLVVEPDTITDCLVVRCFGRLRCACGRLVQAADIELRGGSTVLICQSCFCDLLLIEAGSS
jgi:hypothetical protein